MDGIEVDGWSLCSTTCMLCMPNRDTGPATIPYQLFIVKVDEYDEVQYNEVIPVTCSTLIEEIIQRRISA